MAQAVIDAHEEPGGPARARASKPRSNLGADGGYDAVQMRDVAQTAGVALGTIYRYFSSKDHLLAETLVEWAADLGRKVSRRPPKGDTLADRVVDVLRRATRGDGARAEAVRSGDHRAHVDRPARGALPARGRRRDGRASSPARSRPSSTPHTRDDIVRVLGHVWFSSLVGWVNRWYGINHVGDELEIAAHLLLDQYD